MLEFNSKKVSELTNQERLALNNRDAQVILKKHEDEIGSILNDPNNTEADNKFIKELVLKNVLESKEFQDLYKSKIEEYKQKKAEKDAAIGEKPEVIIDEKTLNVITKNEIEK